MEITYRRKGQVVTEHFEPTDNEIHPDRLDLTGRTVVRVVGRKAVRAWEQDKGKFGNAVVVWSYDHRLGWGAGIFDPTVRPEEPKLPSVLTREEIATSPAAWMGIMPILRANGWTGAIPSFSQRSTRDLARAIALLWPG